MVIISNDWIFALKSLTLGARSVFWNFLPIFTAIKIITTHGPLFFPLVVALYFSHLSQLCNWLVILYNFYFSLHTRKSQVLSCILTI